MAVLKISIDDDASIQRAFGDIERRASDLTPAYREIGEYLSLRVEERFQKEEGPDGRKWQRLSGAYQKEKARSGKIRKVLQREGTLVRQASAYRADAGGVEQGANLPYASLHQLGGRYSVRVTPKMRRYFWAMHKRTGDDKYKAMALTKKQSFSITMPARPYLGLNAEDEREIEAIVRDYLLEG